VKSLNQYEIMSLTASALVCTVMFVNLFANCMTMRQHQLTPIQIFCHILIPYICYNFTQM